MEMTDAMRRCMHRDPALRKPGVPAPPVLASVPLADKLADAPAIAGAGVAKKKSAGLSKPRARRKMNRTEASFALILEVKKRECSIARYEWEGMTLRWPDGMTYSPDFTVFEWHTPGSMPFMQGDGPIHLTFIETKGAFIEGDALVKFRAARENWKEFNFEMHQLKKGTWTRIL